MNSQEPELWKETCRDILESSDYEFDSAGSAHCTEYMFKEYYETGLHPRDVLTLYFDDYCSKIYEGFFDTIA